MRAPELSAQHRVAHRMSTVRLNALVRGKRGVR
jgi:hypothetical protein